MKVNIYYGGRGMVDDPTIFVMGKIQAVLEELNVNVTRYNPVSYTHLKYRPSSAERRWNRRS